MKKILVFDSGFGGLSVLRELLARIPEASYLYYCDTEHVPYGEKDKEQILKLTELAIQKVGEDRIQAFVIACNTATSAAASELRKKYQFPIIGIEPAIKPASLKTRKKILVLATPFTLKEEKFKDLVKALEIEERIIGIPATELVYYVERGETEVSFLYKILDGYFEKVDLKEIGAVVLGCTHYLFLQEKLKLYFEEKGVSVDFFDGNQGVAKYLRRNLHGFTPAHMPEKTVEFYSSSKDKWVFEQAISLCSSFLKKENWIWKEDVK